MVNIGGYDMSFLSQIILQYANIGKTQVANNIQ